MVSNIPDWIIVGSGSVFQEAPGPFGKYFSFFSEPNFFRIFCIIAVFLRKSGF